MSFLDDFPGVKQYDGDLGWLIRAYRMFGEGLEDLQKRVAEMEDLYDSIPNTINAAIKQMQDQVNASLTEMQKQIDGLEADVNAKLNAWEIQFNQMVADFNKLWLQIHNYVDSQVDYMKAWVKAYLEEWAREYPYLLCPVDGRFEPLQEILFHLYNDLSWGIPARDFDALNMTAEKFDAMNIEAQRLDKWGRIIFIPYRFCYMYSPFTGEYVPVQEVILGLAKLHQNGVSAQEYDDGNITAQALDDKAVDAYPYDWTSVWFDELTGG